MSVYVDTIKPTIHNANWPYDWGCHLTADSETELCMFAAKIDLRQSWIQRGTLLHFDLTINMRRKAVRAGAKQITDKEQVNAIHRTEIETEDRRHRSVLR